MIPQAPADGYNWLMTTISHVVVPHLQRAGVGRALCLKAIGTARERGFKRMMLDTADLQVEAVSLFEDLGFRRSVPHRDYSPEVLSRVVFMVKDLD